MSGTRDSAKHLVPAAVVAGVAAGAVLLSAPYAAAAQSAGGRLGGEAALTTATVAGSDFSNVGIGVGGELGVRYAATRHLSVGVAGQASWHDADGLPGSLRLLGAVVEPRYRVAPRRSGPSPFVGARLGLAGWSVTESGERVRADVSAGGLQAGAVAGFAYPVSARSRLELAAVASLLSFGDAEVEATLSDGGREPFVREGSETSGSFLGLRALLRVGLP